MREKWQNHLDQSSFKPNTKNLWQTIRKLSNPQKQSDNTVISFNDKPTPDAKKCANEFNRQFTPHPNERDKTIRNTMRNIHKLKADESTTFTPAREVRCVGYFQTGRAS